MKEEYEVGDLVTLQRAGYVATPILGLVIMKLPTLFTTDILPNHYYHILWQGDVTITKYYAASDLESIQKVS